MIIPFQSPLPIDVAGERIKKMEENLKPFLPWSACSTIDFSRGQDQGLPIEVIQKARSCGHHSLEEVCQTGLQIPHREPCPLMNSSSKELRVAIW